MEVIASMAWVMASIPVLTVSALGKVSVKRGSRTAVLGTMWSSTMYTLRPADLLFRTETFDTSLPVPAVVGMAMCGACGSVSRLMAM